jgi:PIN domain nuclease of toxin-antitoxin system
VSVNLLLDTHTFLWWDSGNLDRSVVKRIQAANDIYVSAASAWEIAIKASLGKIDARASLAEAILDYGFLPLAITLQHADAVRNLPRHHRDPFDRILVAQAMVEQLALVSKDPMVGHYNINVVWH